MNQQESSLLSSLGKKTIKFYQARGKYGYLSNLYKVPVEFEGRTFPTSEHAYQYGKFRNKEDAEWAMTATQTRFLAYIAHGLTRFDISPGWSRMKVDRMKSVVLAKFTQNNELRRKLLSTGDAILVEDSTTDPFWGIGKKGNGKNMLGKILMGVREKLKDFMIEDLDPYELRCLR